MVWYVASAVMELRPRSGRSWPSFFHENCYLVESETPSAALELAEAIARRSIVADEGLELDGVSAEFVFLGIRKLTAIANPIDVDLDRDAPITGSELTYNEVEIHSEMELARFLRGEKARVSIK
jgi:hypothetical protein